MDAERLIDSLEEPVKSGRDKVWPASRVAGQPQEDGMLFEIRVGRACEQFTYGGIDDLGSVLQPEAMKYLIERRCVFWIFENATKQAPRTRFVRSP
jgi:hypothetical protein